MNLHHPSRIIRFAGCVGVGDLTGSGFGALKWRKNNVSSVKTTGSAGAPTGEKKKDSKQPTVRFDREYDGAKSKLVTIETSHRASFCPVIVEGPEEAVQFARCVGVDEVIGSGLKGTSGDILNFP